VNGFNLPEPQSKSYFYVFRNGQWIQVYKSEAEYAEFIIYIEYSRNNWSHSGAYRSIGQTKGKITYKKGNRRAKVFIRQLDSFVFEEVYFGKDYV